MEKFPVLKYDTSKLRTPQGILVDWQHFSTKSVKISWIKLCLYTKNPMLFNSKIDFAVPVVLYKWQKEKQASAFLNLTLTTKIRGGFLYLTWLQLTRDISHCMDREWDVWETFFWTFQFSIFIISQKKERGRKKRYMQFSCSLHYLCNRADLDGGAGGHSRTNE